MSISDSLKNRGAWDDNNTKQKEIDQLVAEMIALQNLPFNFVKGVGFKRLIQAAYHLRGRQHFTKLLCSDIYGKKLSFTTDVWSELSANVSLLSLTAHGITNKFERVTIILKCEQGSKETRKVGTLVEF